MAVNVSGGPLEFQAGIDLSNFERDLARMHTGIRSLTEEQKKQSEGVESFAKKASAAAASFLSVGAATYFVKSMVEVRGQFQQIEVAFTTMLKSKDAADKLMAQAVQLAAITPFTLQEVASGAKQLLAYGFAAENVTKNLEMLGNIASGVGSDLNSIVYLYGTLKASGRVTQMDINQFAGRGIPIYKALADVMKINENQVRSYVTAGKVGFPQVEAAFRGLTGPAGQFFNLMQNQSQTLTGQLSNLSDAWDRMLNDLGKSNEGVFSSAIGAAISLINNYQDVIDIIEVLIATYGAYRAALVLTSIASGASTAQIALETVALSVLRNGLLSTITTLKLFSSAKASALLSTSALTAVIAALGVSIYSVVQLQSAEEIAQKSVNDAMADGARAADSEKGKIAGLVSTIQSHKSTKEEQKRAYDELQSEMGNYLKSYSLEEVAAGKASGAISLFAGHIANLTIAEKEYAAYKGLGDKIDELSEKGIKAVTNFDRLGQSLKNTFGFGGLSAGDYFKSLVDGDASDAIITRQMQEKYRKAQEKLAQDPAVKAKIEAAKVVADAKKQAEDIRKKFDDLLARGASANFSQLLKIAPDKSALEKLQKSLTDTLESLAPDDKARDGLKKKIQAVSKIIADSYSTSTKEATKQSNDRKNFLDNLNKLEAAGLAKSLSESDEALRAIQNKYDEQRKKANELKLGPGVIKRIDNLEKAETGLVKYEQETALLKQNLEVKKNLQAEYESDIEKFGIDAAKQRYAGLQIADKSYYKSLLEEVNKLDAVPVKQRSGNQNERLKALTDLLNEETKRQRDADAERLSDALSASETFEVKRLNLIDEYLKKKKIIEDGADVQDKAGRLQTLKQETDEEISNAKEEAIKKLDVYKDLAGDINKLSAAQAKKDIAELNRIVDAALKAGLISLEVANKFRKLGKDANEALDDRSSKKMIVIANGLDTIAAAASNAGGAFGDAFATVASSLSGALRGIDNIRKISAELQKATTEEEKFEKKAQLIAAGIGAAINLYGMFSNAAKERKAAEKAYYDSMIASQNEYNVSLIDQMRIQEQLKGKIFLKDYKADILNASKALSKANTDLSASFLELQKGQAKDGQKNAVNGKSVLGGATNGAILGAAVGSVVPVIGTAVGAVVGGIAGAIGGLFGGKKKVDTLVPLLSKYPDLIRKAKDGTDEFNQSLAENLVKNNQVDEKTKALLQNTIELNKARQAAIDQINADIKDLAGSLGDDLRNSLVKAFEDGTDAAEAFGDSVGKVIENIVSQFLFNEIFGQQFEDLEKRMKESFGLSGDGSVVDDLTDFYKSAGPSIAEFQSAIAAAKDVSAKNGINIFQPSGSGGSAPTTLSGAIKGITADQANLLAGQFNGQRIATLQGNDIAVNNGKTLLEMTSVAYQTLDVLNIIAANTLKTATNTDQLGYLKPMSDTLTSIDANNSTNNLINTLRAAGKI